MTSGFLADSRPVPADPSRDDLVKWKTLSFERPAAPAAKSRPVPG